MTTHYFTVDVEEYFQVSAFETVVPRSDWGHLPSRAAYAMAVLLDLLARHNVRGTFFVLGWLARRRPEVVRSITAAGHEVASHGWAHERVTGLSHGTFRRDVRRARETLEDICGTPVVGYRAPSFSITRANDWALDVLIEEGHRYDSSLVPVRRPGYGYAGGHSDVHWISRGSGRLLELPPTTLMVGGIRLPAGGGAYFRLFPEAVTHWAFRDCERRASPGTFYLHPWELDPEQPRFDVPWWTRVRHYGGLRHTAPRLERLLSTFRFGPIGLCPELQ